VFTNLFIFDREISSSAYLNYAQIHSWNQSVLIIDGEVPCSMNPGVFDGV